MVYFRKTAQILGGIVALVLMSVGTENTVASEFVPGYLRVMVNTKIKDANKRIDKFLKSYGDNNIKILLCKNKVPCGIYDRHPFRNVLVEFGTESAWIYTLRRSPLIKEIKLIKEYSSRSTYPPKFTYSPTQIQQQPNIKSPSQIEEFPSAQALVQVVPEQIQQQPNIQSAIERYPTIKCPVQVKPGKKFPVWVSLTKDLITSQKNLIVNPFLKVSSKDLHSVSQSTNQEKWVIEMVLAAPNFAFYSPETMKITISHDSNSTVAPFQIAAEPIRNAEEKHNIEATLWHQGAYLTRIVREITVTKVSTATQPTPKQADTPATLQRDLQSPDMTVRIQYHLGNNPIILIHSNKLPYYSSTKKFSLPEDVSQWLNSNYNEFSKYREISRNINMMKGFGRQLYDKFAPEEFKKAFWALKDKLGDEFDTIHILTDDPVIPWELMIPRRGTKELKFLGMDFKIARWHINNKDSTELARPSQFLNLQKLLAIIPEYPDDYLANARNELGILKTVTGFRRIPARYENLNQLFQNSALDNSIIHFAGHGIVEKNNQGLTRYAIKLENGELDLMDFQGIIPPLPKMHSLFFFNACDIGQAHHVANFVDGWAPTVLEAGDRKSVV